MPVSVKPHFVQTWAREEFRVTVRTNGLGWREDFELPAGRRIDVGVLGDSFTFGQGVEAGERYSDVLRARLGERLVVSYAYANGWAPPHYHLYLHENPALVPRVAVLGLFLGNDLTGDMHASKVTWNAAGEPIRVEVPSREIDELGHLIVRDSNRLRRLLRRTWSGRFVLHLVERYRPPGQPAGPRVAPAQQALDDGHLEPTARRALSHVAAIRDVVRTRGGELVVLFIPWSFYVDERYRSMRTPEEAARVRTHLPLIAALVDWCRTHAVVCVSPIERLRAAERAGQRTYFAGDSHWTPVGHRVAAEALLGEVQAALARTR